jgi:hypothetical protein
MEIFVFIENIFRSATHSLTNTDVKNVRNIYGSRQGPNATKRTILYGYVYVKALWYISWLSRCG